MRYEKRQYELWESLVRIDDDGTEWFIPSDESNSDYQRYLRYLAGEDEATL